MLLYSRFADRIQRKVLGPYQKTKRKLLAWLSYSYHYPNVLSKPGLCGCIKTHRKGNKTTDRGGNRAHAFACCITKINSHRQLSKKNSLVGKLHYSYKIVIILLLNESSLIVWKKLSSCAIVPETIGLSTFLKASSPITMGLIESNKPKAINANDAIYAHMCSHEIKLNNLHRNFQTHVTHVIFTHCLYWI